MDLQFIGDRLKQARLTLAYSIEEVCQATGINSERLIGIEEGKVKPSGDEVLILASLFNCDYRALLNKATPSPVQKTDILFRRYGDSFRAEDRRAIQEFLYLCQTEASLEKAVGHPSSTFSFTPHGKYYKGHGQEAAQTLRHHLNYDDLEVPRDVFQDFRAIGIHIFRRKLSNDEISGLYIEDATAGHCVLINYNEDIYRQRFSVAHEVAHAIFDSSDGVMVTYESISRKYNKDDLREIRANSFASYYLMPPSMLNKLPSIDENSAIHWAQQFRVSTAALAKALKDANLVTSSVAQKIKSVRVPTEEKIDPEAPANLTPIQLRRRKNLLERGLSDHYVGICFDAYERGMISFSRLAEALHVESTELTEVGSLYGRTLSHGF